MSALGQQKKRRRQVSLPGSVEKHNPKDKAAELSDGLRRLKKMRVVNLNQQIAEHTKRKDLGAATAAFQRARELGVANDFTYTNLINCQVRCGEVAGASKLLKRMRREGLKPGVIAYTTVLKGHAGRGDLGRIEYLLREMAASDPPIEPNVRTINTCLRGCVMVGAVSQVQAMLARMRASAVSPDGSTREYAATLLCQGLRIDEARPLVAALAADTDHVATASARLGLSRASLVLGQWSVARKEIKEFERSLDAIVQAEQAAEDDAADRDSEDDGVSDEHGDDPSAGGGTGGRRGWRVEATRQRSAVAFNSHRVAEWRREATVLREYLQYASNQPDDDRRQMLASHFRRVFYFRLQSETRPKTGAHSKLSQPERIDVKQADAQRQYSAARATSADEIGTSVCERLGAAIALPELPAHTWVETAATCFDDAGNLDFRQIFRQNQAKQSGDHHGQCRRPVHLEVGSGGGEWACAQAAATADSVDWVTLELRSDRVYHTFLNCVFNKLTNLAMLGGDVHKVAAKIRPGSLGAIFVNHPEPPHQYDDGGSSTGGSEDGARGGRSDGEHMLTPKFFAAAYKSLEPGGRLTIVTDNQHYARLLLQSIAALSDGGKRHFHSYKLKGGSGDTGGGDAATMGGITVEEASGEMFLYKGQPGPVCGHAVVASSYFDRLWKTGASKSASASARYMLCLKREGQAPKPSTERVEVSHDRERQEQEPNGQASQDKENKNKRKKKKKKEKRSKKAKRDTA